MDQSWECRKLTMGTADHIYHWCGYYDTPLFDYSNRFLVAYQVRFQGRHPNSNDIIKIGIIDLLDHDRWIEIGESRAWNWQQGTMVQWLPGTRRVIWNDREGDRFISRIYNLENGNRAALPHPIYTVSPQGDAGLTLNFSRLNDMRPGYGYSGIIDRNRRVKRPDDDGIWAVDLNTGESRLILSLYLAKKYVGPDQPYSHWLDRWLKTYKYWFNHIKCSPDGRRFTVKYRYLIPRRREFWNDSLSHSLTCGRDGNECRYLVDKASHAMWKDNHHLYLWRENGLFLYEDTPNGGHLVRQIAPGVIRENAHVRYFPNDETRLFFDIPYKETVPLYCYDEKTGEKTLLASFANHWPASGEFRCDLHPCFSSDGCKIAISSLLDGGRQVYILERL